MLGTCITAGLVTIEVGLVAYNLHKQGVFKDLASKFKKQVNRSYQVQPRLKELVWKH